MTTEKPHKIYRKDNKNTNQDREMGLKGTGISKSGDVGSDMATNRESTLGGSTYSSPSAPKGK